MVTKSMVINGSQEQIMAALADLEGMASVSGNTSVEILQTQPDGRPVRAKWHENYGPIPDEFILDYEWSGNESVSWRLVEGRILQREDGRYDLIPLSGDQTQVTYMLDLALAMPLPGLVTDQIASSVLADGLAALRDRVESGK